MPFRAGYVPLHERKVKPPVVQGPPPRTGKALLDYGHRAPAHLVLVKKPHEAKSWEMLAR
jgi:hypothetical protein